VGDIDRKSPYVWFMLLVSILSLVGLAITTVGHLDPEQAAILDMADNFVCVLFFADFLVSLYSAPNRWSYFLRWGWLDLLSSVPAINAFRVTRAARVLRVLRVIRGIRATKVLTQFIVNRRAESAFLAVSLLSLLLVVVSSIAILQFEGAPGSNISSAEDAVWWALETITTVGYGDRYPVTDGGRLIATFLMVFGVGVFGTLSGFVASWFLKPEQEKLDSELATLIAEIRELRKRLDDRD
jgi:voltage-gated potassium channel